MLTTAVRTRVVAPLGLLAATVGGLLFLVAHQAMGDDAYISLSYAVNLAEAGHWGLLPDRTANTATSPLNVWLLAAGILVSGRPVVAVGLLLVATLALAAWWADGLRRDLDLSRALPYLLVALLVTSPLLASTVGLETYLAAAALLGVARYAVAGRAVATGALCGLAVLTRPDLAVPAGVLALGLCGIRAPGNGRTWRAAAKSPRAPTRAQRLEETPPRQRPRPLLQVERLAAPGFDPGRVADPGPLPMGEPRDHLAADDADRGLARPGHLRDGARCASDPSRPAAVEVRRLRHLLTIAAVAGLVALPWHLFAWWVLGGFVPDTTWLKTLTPAFGPGGPTLLTAPVAILGVRFPVETTLTAIPVPAAIAAVVWALVRRGPWTRITVALFAAGWAHLAALVAIGATPYSWYYAPLLICSICCVAIIAVATAPRVAAAGAGLLVAAALVAAQPVPWVKGPMHGDLAPTYQYRAIAAQLGPLTGGAPVKGPGEIGVLAFHATPRCQWSTSSVTAP